MSKSIYEESFNHLDELVDVLANIEGSFLYRHYLDNIRLKLKKAQKQEKLLELYRKLSVIRNDLLSYCEVIDDDYDDFEYIEIDLEKQIEEVEND